MKSCISNKKIYESLELAEDALIDARSRFSYREGTGPVAVYRCDDCGCYHLTSKGVMNEKLARQIADGKIKLQQEANRWLDRLKRK